MWIKDIIFAFPSLSEFGLLSRAILPVMKDPDISRDKKRKMLASLLDKLSDRTFNNGIVLNQVITIINMKKDVCEEYVDTEAQVNGILEWLPRMKAHRDKLVKEVTRHRKKYGLKI